MLLEKTSLLATNLENLLTMFRRFPYHSVICFRYYAKYIHIHIVQYK